VTNVSTIENILAVVALEEAKTKVEGGVPIFIARDKEEQEKIALLLSRVLKAMAHDLENGLYIITRH